MNSWKRRATRKGNTCVLPPIAQLQSVQEQAQLLLLEKVVKHDSTLQS